MVWALHVQHVMSHSIPPAIRRAWNSADSNADVLHTVKDDTNFHRGFGRTGSKIEHVEHTCPCCGHDEMIRQHRLHPEDDDSVMYWCLMPNCRYFVADQLSWATKPHPQHVPESPMEWTQTHVCLDCGRRTSKTVTKAEYGMKRVEDGVVKDVCDDCADTQEVEA